MGFMEKSFTDQRLAGWSSTCIRVWWMIMGCFPPPIERQAVQGFMYVAVEVADDVANMLVTCREFKVTAFNPRGASGGILPIATHLRLMAEAFVTIARRGVADDPAAAARARTRVDAAVQPFVDAINMVKRYTPENFAAIQLSHNHVIIESFLVRDMEVYIRAGSQFADDFHRVNFFPPASSAIPPASLPLFQHIRAYIQAGGVARAKGVYRQFARHGACRFGNRCTFSHKVANGKRKTDGRGSGGGDGKSRGGPAGALLSRLV